MQFAVDVGEMSLHGAITEVELRADGFVGAAARREFEHVGFAGVSDSIGWVSARPASWAMSLRAMTGSSADLPSCTSRTA